MTPLDFDRAAWLGSLVGISQLTGESLATVAAQAGTPPYAKEGDGEREQVIALAERLDAYRAEQAAKRKPRRPRRKGGA
jgi:hypothetical protein